LLDQGKGGQAHTFWAYHTNSKSPYTIRFRPIYGKPCHISIKLEHKAY